MDAFVSCQEEILGLARQKRAFVDQRQRTGGATLLDLRAVEQEIAMLQAEADGLTGQKAQILEEIQAYLGFPPGPPLSLNVPAARQQVMGSFDPAAVSFEQVEAASFDLRIHRLKEEIQDYAIKQAYGKYVPTLSFGVQTPDPLSSTEDKNFYFTLGINLPVWDNLNRARNVTRQKISLRQVQADTVIKRTDLANQWRTVQTKMRSTAANVKLARSHEDLVGLKKGQAEIRYKANGTPLTVLLDEQMAHVQARKQLLNRILEQDVAVLQIRHASGDLFRTFVRLSAGQE
jgi:outer membrane protein TolC